MYSELTLSDLTSLSGLEVLEHLDRQVAVPITAGLQAQGDLIVIPYSLVRAAIVRPRWSHPVTVPR